MQANHNSFDEQHLLHELKHYLPSQTPLKDFIHHNSMHAFQEKTFFDGIFKASSIFGYQVTLPLHDFRQLYQTGRIRTEVVERVIAERKGAENGPLWKEKMLTTAYDCNKNPRIGHFRANWKNIYHIDLDNLVQPLLFRIVCSYLDQGIAAWQFPNEKGLLKAVRSLEKNSFTSFFSTKRAKALLLDETITMTDLLKIVVGEPSLYEQYVFDQQFTHHGWSGMASAIEDNPESVLYRKTITLNELIILELILEIDALEANLGKNWQPLAQISKAQPLDLFADKPLSELEEVLILWQKSFEWSYYDEVLRGVQEAHDNPSSAAPMSRSFQAIFCIDEREDSLRRHIEEVDRRCETLGCPGFFGVEFYFQPEGGKFYEKLCPAPVTPKFLIKESAKSGHQEKEVLYSKKSYTFLQGFIFSSILGIWASIKLLLLLFRPKMSPAISDAFSHMSLNGQLTIENTDPNTIENGLQLGFSLKEMTDRVEGLLRNIGLIDHFADIVYVIGHGSSSANNPHHGAHDCGACSGRPGATNARVFSFMANHPKVREGLILRGISIPETTQFLGGLHDTAADGIGYYDEAILSEQNAAAHKQNKAAFENALDLNAKERSRRFASIDTKKDIKHIREAIRKRSVSLFEPRPELGHGTNALCFVGSRNLTKQLFLDRRAFMNSYDYRTDPEGKLLLGVMRPLPPVCGGINLEYYFSRVDNYKVGAGTKLPHNVMGLIGVANSSDGDLRPGLPLQMIEVHDPVRLMIIVEHYPDVILKTVQSDPSLYEWFKNGWVHLTAIHPDSKQFYYLENEAFSVYQPLKKTIDVVENMHDFIEKATEMATNHIVDATKENLSITLIKK